jgi:hypothetical protein
VRDADEDRMMILFLKIALHWDWSGLPAKSGSGLQYGQGRKPPALA